ncbi:GRASP55/65 PDZ-like domain-domain-containing protein [Coniella lustricola]|uniref:GRASP55/65 PDZ-like domain-domain-containing protein n=1 Tax=Coniella lustricola TaxID=2025994 RepID=A0A2T3AGX0_9PEZI|nr:GRASP55/65 PDZ-like domain-domain-containing protein [Coniella lustricola]
MFTALNRFISRLDGDDPRQKQQQGHSGFQVLRNDNQQLHIEPWFDFIVGINGRELVDPSAELFAQEIRNCAGSTVTLGLWSAKGQRTRTLHCAVSPDTASLGLKLQWTSIAVVANIWHVLDVPANSPADIAGLLPYSDYIIGSPEGMLHGESGLSEIVEDHIGSSLRLYVYNNEYNVTRIVTLQPSRTWGGDGALGCVLGYGALHRIPAPLSEPVDAPGEMMFDGGELSEKAPYAAMMQAPPPADGTNFFTPADQRGQIHMPGAESGDFLVPAQMSSPPPPLGNAPPRSQKKKDRHANRGAGGMDDYFNEQEQKSRELDRPDSTRNKSPVAPPPKAGGPPKGGPPRADTPKIEGA